MNARLFTLLLVVAICAACVQQSAFGEEDFGFGIAINHRLEKVKESLEERIELDPQIAYSNVRGTFVCTDNDAEYTVAYQDYDFNGRVDSVRVAMMSYRLAGVVLGGPG